MADLDKLLDDAGRFRVLVGTLTDEQRARIRAGLESERDRLRASTETYQFVSALIEQALSVL